MKRVLLGLLLVLPVYGQFGNASSIQNIPVKAPLSCSDTYVITYVAANSRFECLAAGGGGPVPASSVTAGTFGAGAFTFPGSVKMQSHNAMGNNATVNGDDPFWGPVTTLLTLSQTITTDPGVSTVIGEGNTIEATLPVSGIEVLGHASSVLVDSSSANGNNGQGAWFNVVVTGTGTSLDSGGVAVTLYDTGTNVGTHGSLASGFYSDVEHQGLGTVPTANSYLAYYGSSGAVTNTVANGIGFWANSPLLAASGTMTTAKAFRADDVNISGVGTGYGFWTDTSAGANMWAFYGSGTADSHLGGALEVVSLKTTGSAGSKKVVCVDTATGKLYASSTGTDCSN